MSVFAQTVDVHGTTAFPATPQVIVPFQARKITVINEDLTDDVVHVSFDGKDVHGILNPLIPDTVKLEYTQNVTKVWLLAPAGASTTNVQIIVEG